MPIIKSAKKKLRKDKKRTAYNKRIRDLIKEAIKKAKTNKSEKSVREAISVVNKAAKKNIIHKNKAARLTSSLSKLVSGKKPPTKKISKKKVEKKPIKS